MVVTYASGTVAFASGTYTEIVDILYDQHVPAGAVLDIIYDSTKDSFAVFYRR